MAFTIYVSYQQYSLLGLGVGIFEELSGAFRDAAFSRSQGKRATYWMLSSITVEHLLQRSPLFGEETGGGVGAVEALDVD